VIWESERENSIGNFSVLARLSWKTPSRERMRIKSTFSTPSTVWRRNSKAQNSAASRGAFGIAGSEGEERSASTKENPEMRLNLLG
jgi:hypothetical protein